MAREFKIEGGAAKPVYVVNPAVLYTRYLWGPIVSQWRGELAMTPAARVFILPVSVPWPIEADRIMYWVGATAAGNIRAGIYREGATADSPQGGALVVESASVAVPGINRTQLVTIADTILTPGQYFLALQSDGTTNKAYSVADDGLNFYFYYDRAGGYGAFTNPCPGLTAVAQVPVILLRIKENYPA